CTTAYFSCPTRQAEICLSDLQYTLLTTVGAGRFSCRFSVRARHDVLSCLQSPSLCEHQICTSLIRVSGCTSGTALVLTDVVLGFLRRLVYLRKHADIPVSYSYQTCSL
ncbi:hypothetical protein CY34DRAFT_814307, partial [Suillus luteus UH-Slu-Lm8-n1]